MFTDTIDLHKLGYVGASPFVPVPPPDMIRRIAGADITPAQYRYSGFIVAADVFNQFIRHRGGREGVSIADLGCGPGRTAGFLCQVFPDCEYLGIDVQERLIDWATDTLTPQMPALRFRRVGTETDYAGEKSFAVPTGDETIDLVMAASLFTHLDEQATLGYFREIRRILRADGVACLTYFSFDGERCRGAAKAAAERAGHELQQRGRCHLWGADGVYDTFFHETDLRSFAAETGLRIDHLRAGFWPRTQTPIDDPAAFQDLMVLRRAG